MFRVIIKISFWPAAVSGGRRNLEPRCDSSLWASHTACDPNFRELDDLIVRDRNRLTASARIPSIKNKRFILHVLNQHRTGAVSIVRRILNRAAQIPD